MNALLLVVAVVGGSTPLQLPQGKVSCARLVPVKLWVVQPPANYRKGSAPMNALVLVAVVGALFWMPKWLRVAQREHYIPGSVTTTLILWLKVTWLPNLLLWLFGVLAVVVTGAFEGASEPLTALLAVLVGAITPIGLPLRGKTSPLKLTRRLKTTALLAIALWGLGLWLTTTFWGASFGAALWSVAGFVVVDAALWLAKPLERLLAARYQHQAEKRLREIAPLTIAITGSYGKTSTKAHLSALLGQVRPTVASPASWNNQASLSMAINKHLHAGTEVFVAEMGTYGAGEIRQLCGWVRPEVVAITAIGPVHLQRMKSIERIVAAKLEIVEGAKSVVLNVDSPELAAVASSVAKSHRLVRCSGSPPTTSTTPPPTSTSPPAISGSPPTTSTSPPPTSTELPTTSTELPTTSTESLNTSNSPPSTSGSLPTTADPFEPSPGSGEAEVDVRFFEVPNSEGRFQLDYFGKSFGVVGVERSLKVSNIAVAAALAVEAGLPPAQLVSAIPKLPAIANRAEVAESDTGVVTIDNTFNSNPAGAQDALATLLSHKHRGRSVVVTSGMVELGREQVPANEAFAKAVVDAGAELVIIGQTNRRALRLGARAAVGGGMVEGEVVEGEVVEVGDRDDDREFRPPSQARRTPPVVEVADRDAAREWVRSNLIAGDAVLWENDLPDHYP